VVIDEVLSPIFARGMAARAASLEAVQMCAAALDLTSRRWGAAHPLFGFSSGYARADAMLRELALPEFNQRSRAREPINQLTSAPERLNFGIR
jgi:hypothetical protein